MTTQMSNEGLRLVLFGEFSARNPSAEIKITSRKGRALLAYVAIAPDWRAGREQLAALLWGDKGEVQARQSLRQCLIALRRDLGETAWVVTTVGESVALAPDAVWVDARELQALAGFVELSGSEQAVVIYRGDFPRDFHVGEESIDMWARAERERLQRVAARALEAYAQSLDFTADGRGESSVAEMPVAQDPLREDWQRRLLIGLYARYSCREVALRQADELQTLLRRRRDTRQSFDLWPNVFAGDCIGRYN